MWTFLFVIFQSIFYSIRLYEVRDKLEHVQEKVMFVVAVESPEFQQRIIKGYARLCAVSHDASTPMRAYGYVRHKKWLNTQQRPVQQQAPQEALSAQPDT